MAVTMPPTHACSWLHTKQSHIAAHRARALKLSPPAFLLGGDPRRLHSKHQLSRPLNLRLYTIEASSTDTGTAVSGSANGVYHPPEAEGLGTTRQWEERAASWVAQPTVPGPIRKATDYFDVPLNYYQILGVRESATHDDIWHQHQSAQKALLAEEGYSHLAISARQEILDAAYGVLSKESQRREYTTHLRRNRNSVLSLPWEWLPGALVLAQQAGEAAVVLSCGQDALQQKPLQPFKRDVLLAMTLAQCSLARDDFEAGTVNPACAHLRAALELLQQGEEPSLRVDLQSEIQTTLVEWGPAATLEQLAQPATPGTLTGRSVAVRQSLELVQAALTGAPRGDHLGPNVGWFLAAALESMGADEAVNGLPWEAICKAYKEGGVETGVVLRGAMAHCALGFRNREPKMVEQCGELLGLIVDREGEGADVHAEMAVVALLLGLVDTALDWVSDVTPPPSGRALVAGSVEEALRALIDDAQSNNDVSMMQDLCLYAERYLHSRVLAAFWDTRRSSPPLASYLEDKRVEQCWQTTAGGSPKTTLLSYARVAAEAIHTAVQGAKWAVRHARTKLKAVAPSAAQPPLETPPPVELVLSPPLELGTSPPTPLKKEIDQVDVAERTAAALLSDRRYSAGIRPRLPPLEIPAPVSPQNEEDFAGTHETANSAYPAQTPSPRLRSQSLSPESPALPPVDRRLESLRQNEFRRNRGAKRQQRRQPGRGVGTNGLAGGLLLAGLTLLLGLAGREKVLNRPPAPRPVTVAPVEKLTLKKPPLQAAKTARSPLSDTPPAYASVSPIPQGVRLPDTLPPATAWKRPNTAAAVVLPSMASREAEALVRQWHAAKSDALGQRHALGGLSAVALPPLKSHWAKIAEDARRGGRYWNYKLLDVVVDSAKVWRSEPGGPEEASLEVTIEEAAELVDTKDVSENAVYYSTYRARYSLRRVDGVWRFCEGGKTR